MSSPSYDPPRDLPCDPARDLPQEGKLVRTILRPALGLLLRSQVESVQVLALRILGSDRQVFSGQIPQLSVAAEGAVYRGLHLSQLSLVGHQIQMNLGQVLRGKPLRLLEPVEVAAELVLSEADLNASLRSPLLAALLKPGLETVAARLATAPARAGFEQPWLAQPQLSLMEGALQLRAVWNEGAQQWPVVLQLQLRAEPERLMLLGTKWLEPPPAALQQEEVDCLLASVPLGDVKLETLAIAPRHIRCRGQLRIYP